VYRQISVATPIAKCSALEPPTLLSSCFLMSGLDISKALQCLFEASRQKGGVGLSLAMETDILPALDLVASTTRYSRVKDPERPLTVACFLPDWHYGIMDLLAARIPKQDTTAYFPLVFTGVMVHDLFMEAVQQDKEWHLFSPVDAYPALVETTSFAEKYQELVAAGKAIRVLQARTIFAAIVRSSIVSGTPYVIFADRVNLSSLQAGHIECSNLCAEVMLHSDSLTVASCFLSSIALSRCLADGKLNYSKVGYLTTLATHFLTSICARTGTVFSTLDIVADTTKAIGIGVQGLSDALQTMGIEYDSSEARAVAAKVAACMQYWSMITSVALEMEFDFACNEDTKVGPHHVRWKATLPKSARPLDIDTSDVVSLDKWDELAELEKRRGRANATCIAMMPTVTTAHVQGNSDGIETRVGNVIVKRSSSGDDTLVNPVLWALLKKKLGVEKFNSVEAVLVRDIARADGSVSTLEMLTAEEKRLFRTAFEIDVLGQIGIAAAMSPFVDQSISTNWFVRDPSATKMTSYLIKAWQYGLKTGIYYLRQATVIRSLSTLEEARPALRQSESRTDESVDAATSAMGQLFCTPDCASCSA
jgi:ribonucleoside-diphosphate reductase alpha subunit